VPAEENDDPVAVSVTEHTAEDPSSVPLLVLPPRPLSPACEDLLEVLIEPELEQSAT
jgi:hypothetical protein